MYYILHYTNSVPNSYMNLRIILHIFNNMTEFVENKIIK